MVARLYRPPPDQGQPLPGLPSSVRRLKKWTARPIDLEQLVHENTKEEIPFKLLKVSYKLEVGQTVDAE